MSFLVETCVTGQTNTYLFGRAVGSSVRPGKLGNLNVVSVQILARTVPELPPGQTGVLVCEGSKKVAEGEEIG